MDGETINNSGREENTSVGPDSKIILLPPNNAVWLLCAEQHLEWEFYAGFLFAKSRPETERGLVFLAEKYLPITLLHCDNFCGDAFGVFLCSSSVPLQYKRLSPTHMGSVSRN